jgi:cation:H+ antiporter
VSTEVAIAVFLVSVPLTLIATVAFARQIDRASERIGASEGLHGILTALGADAPEIASAVTALVAGDSKIGVGVVVGSNVFNLAALLGLSALVAGYVQIHRHGLLLNGGVALAVTALGAALVLGAIDAAPATVLLLAVLVPYVVALSVRPGRIRALVPGKRVRDFLVEAVREEVSDLQTGEVAPPATRRDVADLAVSLAGIVLGSIGMVRAATDLGHHWNVSDVIIGTLVLAALTSLPNLLTAVRLAVHGRGSATVSEAFNSNSLNVLAGIAIPALFFTLGAAGGLVTFSVWWLVGMTVVAVVLSYRGEGVRRSEGAVIVALYIAFAAVIASR